MLNENFVFLGTIIYIIGNTKYFIDTLKGKVKPNRVSFFLWSFIPMIAFAAQIQQGVGIQSLTTFMAGFGTFLIFLVSFVNKEAYWKITKFDLVCGGLSFIGIILWFLTRVGDLAILFSVTADSLAAIPTIVKAYKYPETEIPFPWLASGISGLLTLLTITNWTFGYYAFPLAVFVINTLVFILVKFKLNRFKLI